MGLWDVVVCSPVFPRPCSENLSKNHVLREHEATSLNIHLAHRQVKSRQRSPEHREPRCVESRLSRLDPPDDVSELIPLLSPETVRRVLRHGEHLVAPGHLNFNLQSGEKQAPRMSVE